MGWWADTVIVIFKHTKGCRVAQWFTDSAWSWMEKEAVGTQVS